MSFITQFKIEFLHPLSGCRKPLEICLLPMMLAISRRINYRREKDKRKPLEIVYRIYYYIVSRFHNRTVPGAKHLRFASDWDKHPLYPYKLNRGKENLYIHILDGQLVPYSCRKYTPLIQNQHYRYRYSKAKLKSHCFNDANIKSFLTPEDLFDTINEDFCLKNL